MPETPMLAIEPYRDQVRSWPVEGRHILAQFDEQSVVVYQAYAPAIGHYAAAHGRFGGDFSFSRMSWIKPNFLWLMYRSGWGSKEGQQVTLALRINRTFFDELLRSAVPSSWDPDLHSSREEWTTAVSESSVRLQWDPDHDPDGGKLPPRAIQLGLRGKVLEAFAGRELIEVIDVSAFVAEQRARRISDGLEALFTPRERVYMPVDASISQRLRLAQPGPD